MARASRSRTTTPGLLGRAGPSGRDEPTACDAPPRRTRHLVPSWGHNARLARRTDGHRRRRLGLVLRGSLASAGLVVCLASCTTGVAPRAPLTPSTKPVLSGTPTTAPVAPAGRLVLLASARTVRALLSSPATAAVVRASTVYELLGAHGSSTPGIATVPTAVVDSESGLAADLASPAFARRYRAVVLDLEHWSFTPAAEQLDPAAAILAAATVCRAHGLYLIVAPGLDLTAVLAPRTHDHAAAYLALGVARTAAAGNAIDIQAQSLEHSPGAYLAFVRAAAAQAREAAPGVVVLAGVSTNPPSGPISGSALASLMRAVRGDVNGFWVNVPSPGPHCPTCGVADPATAVQALRGL